MVIKRNLQPPRQRHTQLHTFLDFTSITE